MANIYTDVDGKNITKWLKSNTVAFAAAYRASAVKEEDGDEDSLALLPDDRVIAIIEQIPGNENSEQDGQQVRKDRLAALVTESEEGDEADEVPLTAASKSELSQLARKQSEVFDKDVDSILESIADAKETQMGGPVLLADHLFDLYGGERDKESGMMVRCPAVMAWPVPGSSYKSDFWKLRNETPDIHKFKDHATGTEYTIRFYRDLANGTAHGVQLLSDIKDLNLLKDGTAGVKNKELLIYHGKSDQRIAKLSQLQARQSARTNAFSKAAGFIQTITRWNELGFVAKGSRWGFSVADATKHMDEVARRNKPIKFITVKGAEVDSSDPISLSQFLSLQHPAKGATRTRFEVAIALGGTVGNIKDTLKKAAPVTPDDKSKQGGDKDKTGKDIGIPTPEELVATARMFATGLDEAGGNQAQALAYRSRLLKHFNVQTAEITEELIDLDDMVKSINDFLIPYRKRINDALEAQAKAA
jgi:hypothetical protein